MQGIDFLIDENGKKKAAVIDLEKYGEALEDFMDGLVATSRKNERTVSLDTLKRKIRKK